MLEKGRASAAPGHGLSAAEANHPDWGCPHTDVSQFPVEERKDSPSFLLSKIVLNPQSLKEFLVKTIGTVHCLGLVGVVFQTLCDSSFPLLLSLPLQLLLKTPTESLVATR